MKVECLFCHHEINTDEHISYSVMGGSVCSESCFEQYYQMIEFDENTF